jgi:hypothetical protein
MTATGNRQQGELYNTYGVRDPQYNFCLFTLFPDKYLSHVALSLSTA